MITVKYSQQLSSAPAVSVPAAAEAAHRTNVRSAKGGTMSRLPVVILVIALTCGGAQVVAFDRALVVPEFMLDLVSADKPLADVVRSVSPFKTGKVKSLEFIYFQKPIEK